MMIKDRFGVVDVVTREKYEKEYQLPYGYQFISYDETEAITECRRLKNDSFIVERIHGMNCKEEIFRNFQGDQN